MFKEKAPKPMIPTEWFLHSKGWDDGYNMQNDFIDQQNKKCASESLNLFGGNCIDIYNLKTGGIFKMLDCDDRVVYCVGINDRRKDLCGRKMVSIFGVVLDKRNALNYAFDDFKAEVRQKSASIEYKYPTIFDLAILFPINFSQTARPIITNKNNPNGLIDRFDRYYNPDKDNWCKNL